MKTEVPTHYFPGEGRESMRECIDRSVEACLAYNIGSLVIFTGTGEGPHYAAKELLPQGKYSNLHVVAVTPPFGRAYLADPRQGPDGPLVRAGINPAMRDELEALGISVVAAHLPFKEMQVGRERVSEWSRVAEALGVLGGGFALCIQAVLLACDAGAVPLGERVVVASADTALIVWTSRTELFLSPRDGLLVEHILCRPRAYQISKANHRHVGRMWGAEIEVTPVAFTPESSKALPLPATVPQPPSAPPKIGKARQAKAKTKPSRSRRKA